MANRLSDAIAALEENLDAHVSAALVVVGAAWAAACTATAPPQTGRLAGSFVFVPTGPMAGEIRMVYDGAIVRQGAPPHTAVRTLKATARRPATAITARSQGHAPNDFARRAWESDEVQETVARFPVLVFVPDL